MTVVDGSVIEPAVRTFHIDVAIRSEDAVLLENREAVYETITERIEDMSANGLDISIDQLFSWAVCQELAHIDGRRTRGELASRVQGLRAFAMRDVSAAGPELRLSGPPSPGVVEYLGVGTGLSVVDALFDLDASYIRRIPETPASKTLDFDGRYGAAITNGFLQIELKGRKDGMNRTKAWKSIGDKKHDFREGKPPDGSVEMSPRVGARTYLVGLVAEIPYQRAGTTRVVFGDPPTSGSEGDPERSRLLQRLHFYRRVLSVVQSRGSLLAALTERIGSLDLPDTDWQIHAGRRLLNSKMEKLELSSNVASTIRIDNRDRIHGRSILPTRDSSAASATDKTIQIGVRPFFFVGLHRNVLLALARQDFDELARRRYEQRYVRAQIGGASRTLFQLPSGLVISSMFESEN